MAIIKRRKNPLVNAKYTYRSFDVCTNICRKFSSNCRFDARNSISTCCNHLTDSRSNDSNMRVIDCCNRVVDAIFTFLQKKLVFLKGCFSWQLKSVEKNNSNDQDLFFTLFNWKKGLNKKPFCSKFILQKKNLRRNAMELWKSRFYWTLLLLSLMNSFHKLKNTFSAFWKYLIETDESFWGGTLLVKVKIETDSLCGINTSKRYWSHHGISTARCLRSLIPFDSNYVLHTDS